MPLAAGLLAAFAVSGPASADSPNPLLDCGNEWIYENNGACGNAG